MTVHRAVELPPEDAPTLIRSEDLFPADASDNTVGIVHNGMVYTLRITRQGKLLLTK
ncbi:MAG: hemin uptake protein HemP [Pseudomonadota bacterium]